MGHITGAFVLGGGGEYNDICLNISSASLCFDSVWALLALCTRGVLRCLFTAQRRAGHAGHGSLSPSAPHKKVPPVLAVLADITVLSCTFCTFAKVLSASLLSARICESKTKRFPFCNSVWISTCYVTKRFCFCQHLYLFIFLRAILKSLACFETQSSVPFELWTFFSFRETKPNR